MNALRLVTLCFVTFVLAAQPAQSQSSRARDLLAEGDEALRSGDRREAGQKYVQAVLSDRNYVPARMKLGKFRLDAGDLGDAEDHFRAVLRIDPNDLEARYYQGMVKREQGRHRPPLTGWLLDEFKDARDHFEFILARDSLFRDVLYQYALLQLYRGQEQAAMELALRQIELKPDDPAGLSGFMRLGRMFASTRGRSKTDWLEPLSPDFRTLFEAEAARREGALGPAQALLLDLLQKVDSVPRSEIHLLLARIFVAGEHTEAAEGQFWSAVEAIRHRGDAALIFDEVKYVLNDHELALYDSLETPEAYREFFQRVWASRDPMPAAASNARLVEHLRRLNTAEKSYEHFRPRTFFNDPDVNSALIFGRIYTLNQSFNDKGLIFIRHGPPDVRIFTSDEESALSQALRDDASSGFPSASQGPLPVESWRYYGTDSQPELIFHFATRAGGNWRLIAAPMWLQALNDRREWGSIYAEAFQALANGESLEIPRLNMRMQHEAQEFVEVGLQTDRHSWSGDVVALQLPATVAAFRGEDRTTRVDVFYAFPTSPIAGFVESTDPVPVEIGLAVHDDSLNKIVNRRDKKLVLPSATETDVAAGSMSFSVEPGTYTVSMHVKPEDTPLLGGWQSAYTFPDFSTGTLTMSDLLLATRISEDEEASPFRRGELTVIPSFTGRFTTEQPLFVYYELYNLALDATDHTAYVTDIELHPLEGRRRGPFGLFGRNDRPVLSLRTEGTGTTISPVEYAQVDMSDVEPGPYRLLIRVTDSISGNKDERTRTLQLVEP